jgi:protein-S-isoprenylcysteine O-methyltransferase Ste14
MDTATRRGVARWCVREFSGTVLVGVVLFWGRGTFDWPFAWVLVGIVFAAFVAQAALLIPRSPGLLAERAKRMQQGTKTFDRIILSIYGITSLAAFVVAALDHRWAWGPRLSPWAQVVGLLLAGLGNGYTTWAMVANSYFAFSVRIQQDRGQKVVSSGPYRKVRHPGYVGAILYAVGAAAALGSYWAMVPALASVVLLVVRTALEDRTLKRELPGYPDYAARTRFRLLPGIW